MPDAHSPILHAYLGISQCTHRADLHKRVEKFLTPQSRTFWDKRTSAIAAGIWHSGRWERVLRLGALGTGLIRGKSIDRLFEATSLADQAKIWSTQFDDAVWHGAVRLLAQRCLWRRITGEPGGAYLPAAKKSQARLTGLFRRASENFLFRESDFATLLFKGLLKQDTALPLHMRPEHFKTIRERLDRIEIAQEGLASLGASRLGPFDAFSLSDFGVPRQRL